MVDPADDPDGILPLAEDVAGKRDFGRNGTYLVMRDLGQDVPRFWQFIDAQAGGDATKRRELARAMVGRMPYHLPVIPEWKNIVPDDDPTQVMPPGSPIAMLSNGSIAGIGPKMKDIWLNQFTYHKDRTGTACPHGAHIRRANPRNADFPEGTGRFLGRLLRIFGFGREDPRDDLVASTRFHRILRRGREYGPQLAPGEATDRNAPAAQRGLRFICLNANISRQFEFIQNSWLASPKFDGLNEDDPMVGSRAPLWAGGRTDTFSIPQDSGLCRRVTGLQQFVTVHGGAYFFMPGLSALRYIASTRAAA